MHRLTNSSAVNCCTMASDRSSRPTFYLTAFASWEIVNRQTSTRQDIQRGHLSVELYAQCRAGGNGADCWSILMTRLLSHRRCNNKTMLPTR